MSSELGHYTLCIIKQNKKLKITVGANDSNHAQAQALDICRGFGADSVVISYGGREESTISTLFERLAFNKMAL